MKLRCEKVRKLVPSYLDGELEEERAGPLRTHLLACPGCREVAKDATFLGRWFDAAREVLPAASAPPAFAARVAGLAFAGVEPTGEPTVELQPAARPMGEAAASKRSLLPFLLAVTTVAAAILFVFAVLLQRQAVPTGASLQADEEVLWVHDGLGLESELESESGLDLLVAPPSENETER